MRTDHRSSAAAASARRVSWRRVGRVSDELGRAHRHHGALGTHHRRGAHWRHCVSRAWGHAHWGTIGSVGRGSVGWTAVGCPVGGHCWRPVLAAATTAPRSHFKYNYKDPPSSPLKILESAIVEAIPVESGDPTNAQIRSITRIYKKQYGNKSGDFYTQHMFQTVYGLDCRFQPHLKGTKILIFKKSFTENPI